jgi:hypothetical protein
MLDVLRKQGLTDVEFLAVTAPGPTWADRADGYEEASFPVMSDNGGVYYMYGVSPYDVILVDKKGRLVTSDEFSTDKVDTLLRKIRDLHAE